ncbi:defective in Cullin neddylation protein 1 [Rhodotorula sp. JG-1b]|nr:defective in Cullin neddylation protein 1 [Rhodotorula sp. JG-1b]
MLNFFGSPPLRPSSAVICSSTRSHNCTAEPITSCAASGGAQSTLSKTAKEGRIREFVEITGASATDAQRLLKATNWRVNAALDAFFNDPRPASSKASAANSAQVTKNLETLWTKYCDPSQPHEISMDGTMQYCADLGVDPSEVIMLALAWFTKAPTMGRFSKREWVEAWQAIGADTLERQKQQVDVLRKQLETPETFRKVYIFAFDYAKTEGQKSLQFEIAQELWNLLIPLDPASSFPPEHLAMWITFLTEKGGRAVSKDSWNLFLDFTRTIDPAFKQYDEDAAWPSVIDDFVEYARARI